MGTLCPQRANPRTARDRRTGVPHERSLMKALSITAVLAAAALAVAGAAFSSGTSTPTLKGVVGPGYSVSLTKGGKKVTSLKAGKYKIVVSDKSNFHSSVLEREKPAKPKL